MLLKPVVFHGLPRKQFARNQWQENPICFVLEVGNSYKLSLTGQPASYCSHSRAKPGEAQMKSSGYNKAEGRRGERQGQRQEIPHLCQ